MAYKLDTYRAEAQIAPFELDLGGDRVISIPVPDGETIVELAETPQSQARRILQLLLGEQYDELWAVLGKENAGVIPALVADLLKHFKIGELQAAPGGRVALPR